MFFLMAEYCLLICFVAVLFWCHPKPIIGRIPFVILFLFIVFITEFLNDLQLIDAAKLILLQYYV